MNRRQKLVQQQFLYNEQRIIKRLNQVYNQALKDVNGNIEKLMKRFDPETGDLPQSAIYQLKYQNMIKDQLEGILNQMQTKEFLNVSDYLDTCYEDGFVGSLFDLHGQDVPLMMPLDQEAMVTAVQLDSKISQGLYTRLGEDVSMLKLRITAEVSRSIANGASFADTAKRLSNVTRIGYNNAIRIARTEGHRIQNQATMNVMEQAKDRGADVVKQWDATLDGKTRESHVAVDGEIRELDEKFSNGLQFPGDPSGGAAEVINCRCAALQRARWAVGGSFTKWNNFTRQLETFDSPQDYGEFKKAFFSGGNKRYMNYVQELEKKYHTRDLSTVLDQMTEREYDRYFKLLARNPVYNSNAIVESNDVLTIDTCNTIADVETLFRDRDWFIHGTGTLEGWRSDEGLSLAGCDLDAAKGVYSTYEQFFDRYPQMKNMLAAPASAQCPKGVYARCTMGFGSGMVQVNTDYFNDAVRLCAKYAQNVKDGFHPAGTSDYAIVMHELGHAMDDFLTVICNYAGATGSSDKDFVSNKIRSKIMKACGMKNADIAREVCEYATESPQEWFAECFAEYMCSDNPRKVATEFGKWLESALKEVTWNA